MHEFARKYNELKNGGCVTCIHVSSMYASIVCTMSYKQKYKKLYLRKFVNNKQTYYIIHWYLEEKAI